VTLSAPFPYFGGKSRVAAEVWSRFGNPARYVEPFAGSLAVLLARPLPFAGREVVNDADGLVANFWRAAVADPAAVAEHADWPATENDLHARHAWLVGQREDITRRLEGDPEWFDARAAGWWVWGIGLWIGGGWCSGRGPWRVTAGQLLHAGNDGRGIHRQLLHAGNDGRGIHRQLLHAGDEGRGIHRKLLHAGNDGRGIHRQLLHAGDDGQGIHRKLLHAGDDGQGSARIVGWRRETLTDVFAALSDRLRDALVMCGDWRRVVTPSVLFGSSRGRAGKDGACAVFLDPPYDEGEGDLYAAHDRSVHDAARQWALANGDDPRLRIAFCGYDGEDMKGWTELAWSTNGGYASQGSDTNINQRRERVWFSPHCLRAGLWDVA